MSYERRERFRTAWAYALLVGLTAVLGLGLWWALGAIIGVRVHPWPLAWPLSWAEPWALFLALAAIPLWWLSVHARRRRAPTLLFSRAFDVTSLRPGWVARTAALPDVLRVLALVLTAAALARPQAHLAEDIELEGIDVMVALDLSKSMEAEDLAPSRLAASQSVLREFLTQRRGDRLGLVVFGRAPMLKAPLTTDTRALGEIVRELTIGEVPPRGTAIGDALGLSLAVLRRSESESRVVILLSDGDSNVSETMTPNEASALAGQMDVRVFTVLMGAERGEGDEAPGAREGSARGAGEKGSSARGGNARGEVEHGVDPDLLRSIAEASGGEFFRAADTAALESTFREVRESLDKTRRELKSTSRGTEIFPLFAWPALVLLLLEVLLRLTRWRRFP